MKQVYLTEPIHEDAISLLRSHFRVVLGYTLQDDRERAAALGESHGVLIRSAHVTEDVMEQAQALQVIAKHGIGVDNIDVAAATARGIQVVNAPLANVNAVAEHTVALLFAAAKHLAFLDARTRKGGFAERNQYLNMELAGKTIGLVGFGRIARLIARKLSGLEMTVLTNDPFCDLEAAKALGVSPVSREELLQRSDIVSLHTPLIPETRKMANWDFFRQMKATAYLINTSRGGVVDEPALIRALQEGEIAGAALDVYEQEPPPADHPFFSMEQVVLSPHNAALTDRAMLAMAMDSAQGICDYLEGRAPQYPVNRPENPR